MEPDFILTAVFRETMCEMASDYSALGRQLVQVLWDSFWRCLHVDTIEQLTGAKIASSADRAIRVLGAVGPDEDLKLWCDFWSALCPIAAVLGKDKSELADFKRRAHDLLDAQCGVMELSGYTRNFVMEQGIRALIATRVEYGKRIATRPRAAGESNDRGLINSYSEIDPASPWVYLVRKDVGHPPPFAVRRLYSEAMAEVTRDRPHILVDEKMTCVEINGTKYGIDDIVSDIDKTLLWCLLNVPVITVSLFKGRHPPSMSTIFDETNLRKNVERFRDLLGGEWGKQILKSAGNKYRVRWDLFSYCWLHHGNVDGSMLVHSAHRGFRK
jgi:hypothetical protein